MNHNEIKRRRVLSLIESIENKTGKMFHEFDLQLDRSIRILVDSGKYGFAIATLTRVLDRIN